MKSCLRITKDLRNSKSDILSLIGTFPGGVITLQSVYSYAIKMPATKSFCARCLVNKEGNR